MSKQDSKSLERVKDMRKITYMSLLDALTGLKKALLLIDERVQREGPNANYSANSDLLEWSMSAWKHSNALYTIDQTIQSMTREEIVNVKPEGENHVDVVTAGKDGDGG